MSTNSLHLRKQALTFGWSLVLMAMLAGLGYGYFRGLLYFPTEAQASLDAHLTHTSVLWAEIATWFFIFLLDLLVAWSLFRFLSHRSLFWARTIFYTRLIYSFILLFAIGQLFRIGMSLSSLSADELLAFRLAFDQIWISGLVLFGFHLMSLGFLCWKLADLPNFWAILLFLAGLSYTLINGLKVLGLNEEAWLVSLEAVLAVPMTVGELGFGIWALWWAYKKLE